ncbi:hypothetical protein QJS10_CPB17g00183 [Acorus calamus]|uniref:Nuclear nucleic acid-binding protein C1D n=1 Tax=Acorus calamus TaxID=4465 RepID=A0AAV9CYS9_ACOCL|nr:hypothetical protein QJS10_CPB17g00183 [Acorus calamus]
MGKREGETITAVPDAVVESVNQTLKNLIEVQSSLAEVLSAAEPEVLAELPPLHRAHVFLILSKSVSTLFAVRLRCNGIDPLDHSIRTELDRLSLYEDKLERLLDQSKKPLRPSATLNHRAATRFIEHSLRDLSSEQKRSLREISKGETGGSRCSESWGAHKKMKYQTSGKQSVRAMAEDFLEKARQEILGASCAVQGPLRDESSDEEDGMVV